MTCVEKFTNIVVSDKPLEEKNELMKILFIMLFVKLIFIYLVARFLWPYVMPKLFKGVTTNPRFIEVLALSVLISLIS